MKKASSPSNGERHRREKNMKYRKISKKYGIEMKRNIILRNKYERKYIVSMT